MTTFEAPTEPDLAPLAELDDLTGLPDLTKITAQLVAAACADVRGYCGWHIAPIVPATLVASGSGRPKLVLPTLRPKLITSVRVLNDRTGIPGPPQTRWRPVTGGMLYRPEGWPAGTDNVVADVEHGFDTCPQDLLVVIADRARALRTSRDPSVASESKTVLGVSRSRTYRSDDVAWGEAARAILDRYRLPV